MKGRAMRRSGTLTVEFIGERHEVVPARQFTFGRHGDLQLDTNPDLPGVVGVFAHENGMWWLRNQTTSIDVHLFDTTTRSASLIAAGTAAPIPYQSAIVRVVVGPSTYELTLHGTEANDRGEPSVKGRGEPTLNLEQRQLLTALAEGLLRDVDPPEPGNGLPSNSLPSNSEVAERLGWRITKLNRKLDHLCIKFDKLGVSGLRGSARRLATERRRLLVEHCVSTGLITADDLALLSNSD